MTDPQLGPTRYSPPPAGEWQMGRIDGLPLSGFITSLFGPRPRTPEMIAAGVTLDDHLGLDVYAPHGTLMAAPTDGVVNVANNMDNGIGFILEVWLPGNEWSWEIYHLAEAARDYETGRDLEPGDFVRRGQVIAMEGATGRATGTHAHIGVKNLLTGQYMDPLGYFVVRPTAIPNALPALSRGELGTALVDDQNVHAVLVTRDGAAFYNAETYRVNVTRDAATGAPV